VVLSYSQNPLPWKESGVVSHDSPLNYTLPLLNLEVSANLTVSFNRSVAVCVVYSDFGLPHWTQYNSDNCIFYFNATKSGDITVLPLLAVEYKLGVYFSEADVKNDQSSQVDLVIDGAACLTRDTYWDESSNSCLLATEEKSNTTFTATFKAGETQFWTYMAPAALENLAFSMVSAEDLRAETWLIYARYQGGPSKMFHDQTDVDGTLTVISPRPGLWVFSVHSMNGGDATFKITEEGCPANKAGPNCAYDVLPAANNMNLTITHGSSGLYLMYKAVPGHGLVVSVTTNNGSDIPFLFATRGQIPVVTKEGVTSDIYNCNREYCDVVRSIALNVTDEEDWYIGIFSSAPGNTTFGVWFNETCVPDCETDNHGECDPSGRCSCEIDFEGIDCSISKGLGPQYIVLIIIASLVVASAIIGFVAWAYMRRKRANYEIVS